MSVRQVHLLVDVKSYVTDTCVFAVIHASYEIWSVFVEEDLDLKFSDLTVVQGNPGTKTQRVLRRMRLACPDMTDTEFKEASVVHV